MGWPVCRSVKKERSTAASSPRALEHGMKNGTPFIKWKERQPRPTSRVWFSSNSGTKPGLQAPTGGRVRPLRSVFALHRPVRRVSSC